MPTPIDTNLLRKAIKEFQFYAPPSDGTRSHPCTIGDLRKVIDKTAKLMTTFVNEIEKSQ